MHAICLSRFHLYSIYRSIFAAFCVCILLVRDMTLCKWKAPLNLWFLARSGCLPIVACKMPDVDTCVQLQFWFCEDFTTASKHEKLRSKTSMPDVWPLRVLCNASGAVLLRWLFRTVCHGLRNDRESFRRRMGILAENRRRVSTLNRWGFDRANHLRFLSFYEHRSEQRHGLARVPNVRPWNAGIWHFVPCKTRNKQGSLMLFACFFRSFRGWTITLCQTSS